MEGTPKEAAFRFVRYLITEASIKIGKESNIADELSIKFDLNITTPPHSSQPTLNMTVNVVDKNDEVSIYVKANGYFTMETEDKKALDKFMAFNAPAILFPYVRAYVSSMTSQAGMRPIMLPTLNLHSIGERLFSDLTAD